MFRYIVSVGSNIEPEKNVDLAFLQIQLIDTQAKMATKLYTKAQGDSSQPDYINTAFLFHSHLDKNDLKTQLLIIEADLGRVRSENKNAAREIDLDITQVDFDIIDDDYDKYDFVKIGVDELNQKYPISNAYQDQNFSELLKTISKFEQIIEKQLKPLDVNYKQVLLLMNVQKNTGHIGENDHASMQYLLAQKWITPKDNQYCLTDSGDLLLKTALKKLENFEKRLFLNQKMQHSLLSQLNKIYGL